MSSLSWVLFVLLLLALDEGQWIVGAVWSLSGDPTRVGETTALEFTLALSAVEFEVSVNEGEDGSEVGGDSDGAEDGCWGWEAGEVGEAITGGEDGCGLFEGVLSAGGSVSARVKTIRGDCVPSSIRKAEGWSLARGDVAADVGGEEITDDESVIREEDEFAVAAIS
jgi:hypothetical protein